jgi:hypothetical protein
MVRGSSKNAGWRRQGGRDRRTVVVHVNGADIAVGRAPVRSPLWTQRVVAPLRSVTGTITLIMPGIVAAVLT